MTRSERGFHLPKPSHTLPLLPPGPLPGPQNSSLPTRTRSGPAKPAQQHSAQRTRCVTAPLGFLVMTRRSLGETGTTIMPPSGRSSCTSGCRRSGGQEAPTCTRSYCPRWRGVGMNTLCCSNRMGAAVDAYLRRPEGGHRVQWVREEGW